TAVEIARKARKHNKSLMGDNHYANKLAELRVDATNCFRDLSGHSTGDITALAELVEQVFSGDTARDHRLENARNLVFSLKTTWRDSSNVNSALASDTVFPMVLLSRTRRGYLEAVGRQANGCCESGW